MKFRGFFAVLWLNLFRRSQYAKFFRNAAMESDLRRKSDEANDGASTRASQIESGFQLGPYRIEAQLAEGGMGVVYRAVDTKLNRPVAIKFLPDDLADSGARRRFQREAQMASSLNHPHILTVYD